MLSTSEPPVASEGSLKTLFLPSERLLEPSKTLFLSIQRLLEGSKPLVLSIQRRLSQILKNLRLPTIWGTAQKPQKHQFFSSNASQRPPEHFCCYSNASWNPPEYYFCNSVASWTPPEQCFCISTASSSRLTTSHMRPKAAGRVKGRLPDGSRASPMPSESSRKHHGIFRIRRSMSARAARGRQIRQTIQFKY